MKLIVGLGNPGARYRNTRHNVGFQVLDAIATRWGVAFDREKFEGLVAVAGRGAQRVMLLKPLTYMNRSGIAVAQVYTELQNDREILGICHKRGIKAAELALLDRSLASLARAASAAGVRVVAGDTKVVQRGQGGGLHRRFDERGAASAGHRA